MYFQLPLTVYHNTNQQHVYCTYQNIKWDSLTGITTWFFHGTPKRCDKYLCHCHIWVSTKHWPLVNWPPTDPPTHPYKINEKMKIKKAQNHQWDRLKPINKPNPPETSKTADALQVSDSLVLLWLFSRGFVDGRSSTEQAWISSNIVFVCIGKWSKEKSCQMSRLAKGLWWTARASGTNMRLNLNRKTNFIR